MGEASRIQPSQGLASCSQPNRYPDGGGLDCVRSALIRCRQGPVATEVAPAQSHTVGFQSSTGGPASARTGLVRNSIHARPAPISASAAPAYSGEAMPKPAAMVTPPR